MTANAIPTAGTYPLRFNKREAKVIECAISGTGSVQNKTIDTTNSIAVYDSQFQLKDNTTPTKLMAFQLSGQAAGTTTIATQGTGATITLPSATSTVATTTLTETFSNKKLDTSCTAVDATTPTKIMAFQLSGQAAGTTTLITGGTNASITLPSATSSLATLALAETFSSKKFDTSCTVVDPTTPSKAVAFSTSGATASTATTLTFAQTVNRAITFPDAAGTVALTSDIGAAVSASATVSLTQADITGLYGTSVQLVAAPVAGHTIIVDSVEILHTYAVSAYADGGALQVQYGSTNHAGGTAICNGLATVVTAGADSNTKWQPTIYQAVNGFDVDAVKATGVYLSNATGAFTGGDAGNVLKVRVNYRDVVLVA